MSAFFPRLAFVKMHGAGNDYIYVDATRRVPESLPQFARAISDRHFGVGGDGLVLIMKSDKADFRMRMFNADGSEAQMCGNASRCVARFVYELGLTTNRVITLETLAGIKTLTINQNTDGSFESVTVDMGVPELRPERIPSAPVDESGEMTVTLADKTAYRLTPVSMGNPHGVIFTEAITDLQVLTHGPQLEVHPVWPEKSNIEFVRVISPEQIEMRVWERGTGETLACGTGACASVVASVLRGHTDRKVEVLLRGGRLSVEWNEESGHLLMTGGADFVAFGEYCLPEDLKIIVNPN